jgi:hypothetical protein
VRATPFSFFAKAVFAFVAVNALAGAVVLMIFPARTAQLFFWEIRPPINAALFGALYLGGAVVVSWVTLRGQWEEARFLAPILVTAGLLISLVTLLHLERFTPGVRLAYWLVVYIGAPLLAAGIYWRHERRGADWTAAQPTTLPTRLIAAGLGAVLTLIGLGLLAWPAPAVALWPWPTTPLVVRIFAAWFTAFGAGLLWFLVERDWRRLRHVATLMVAAAALDLLMVALHWRDIPAFSLSLGLYVFHLGMFGVVGLLLHALQWFAPARRP